MKQFVIADNLDTLTGLRLAGVDGQMIDANQSFKTLFNEVVDNKDYGVIMISPQLIAQHQTLVDDVRFNRATPLIVAIQGPDEYQHPTTSITDTIQQAIGMQL